MPLVIDIGSKYIHLTQGKNKGKLRCKSVRVPEGSIANGEILNVEALAQVIKKTIKEQCYQKGKVTFLVHTSEMAVKEAELPKVKPREMQILLEQGMLGLLSAEERYLMDYKIVETASEQSHKTMIVAMPQALIAGYMQLAKAIGIKKCKIDIHQNSITKLMKNQKLEEGKIIVLANIGNSMLHLHLFDGKSRLFSRSVPINTEQYKDTLILMGQLRDEEAFLKLDLAPDRLEENPILFNLLSPYLSSILSEIQTMLQFQLSRASQNPVSTIYLYGGMANMAGMAEYLENGLSTEVKSIQDLMGDLEVNDLNNYFAGLGEIYLDQGKEINFYEAYKQLEKSNKNLSSTTHIGIFTLAGQVIIGGSIVGYYLLSGRHNYQVSESLLRPYSQPDMIQKLKSLYDISEQIERFKSSSIRLKEIGTQVESLPKLDKTFWNSIMKQMPAHMVVRQVTYQAGNINLECETILEQEILDFVYHLRKLSHVQEVLYTGYQIQDNSYYFTVNLVLKGEHSNANI